MVVLVECLLGDPFHQNSAVLALFRVCNLSINKEGVLIPFANNKSNAQRDCFSIATLSRRDELDPPIAQAGYGLPSEALA